MARKAVGYCIPCKGPTGPRHAATAKHRFSTRPREYRQGSGDWLDSRAPLPRRDRDAEAAEAIERDRSAYADELATLIALGPLPEPPALQYPMGMALITLREAANRLGLAPETLRSAIHRKRMTGHKYGRDWLVEESEVACYEMRSLGKVGWPKGRSRKSA